MQVSLHLHWHCCPGNPSVASRSPRLHYCHLNDIERHWVVLGRYLGIRLDGRLALQWWPLTRLCSAFSRSVRVPSQTGCLSVLAPSSRTLSYVGWATAEMGLHDSCPRSSSGRTKRLTTWWLLTATSMIHRSVLSRRRVLHGYRPRHSYAYCVVAHHAGTASAPSVLQVVRVGPPTPLNISRELRSTKQRIFPNIIYESLTAKCRSRGNR